MHILCGVQLQTEVEGETVITDGMPGVHENHMYYYRR